MVTGGAGFIGGNFVIHLVAGCDGLVINLDKLTYAGNLQTPARLHGNRAWESAC
jgi:dTDP-glucose 4,6-dehydratase